MNCVYCNKELENSPEVVWITPESTKSGFLGNKNICEDCKKEHEELEKYWEERDKEDPLGYFVVIGYSVEGETRLYNGDSYEEAAKIVEENRLNSNMHVEMYVGDNFCGVCHKQVSFHLYENEWYCDECQTRMGTRQC